MNCDELAIIADVKTQIAETRKAIGKVESAVCEALPLLDTLPRRFDEDAQKVPELTQQEWSALLLPTQLVLLNARLITFQDLLLETKIHELN